MEALSVDRNTELELGSLPAGNICSVQGVGGSGRSLYPLTPSGTTHSTYAAPDAGWGAWHNSIGDHSTYR